MKSRRLEELERLAAHVDLEIRREKRRLASEPRSRFGRKRRVEPGHGTELDYQWHRRRGEVPCDLCKAGHAAYNRRQDRDRRRAERAERAVDPAQLTVYDALKEA